MKIIYRFLSCTTFLLLITVLLTNCDDVKKRKTTSSKINQNILDTQLVNKGEILFKDSCGICHTTRKSDNPLVGVVQRLGITYLKLYITKQDSLIKAQNKHAVEIKETFGNNRNAHNYNFSDEQLDAIISYLEKYLGSL